jgi:hypothetical protein
VCGLAWGRIGHPTAGRNSRADDYAPMVRAMTMRWISFVPS